MEALDVYKAKKVKTVLTWVYAHTDWSNLHGKASQIMKWLKKRLCFFKPRTVLIN